MCNNDNTQLRSLLLSNLKRHTCAVGRLVRFRFCLIFDLILFYIHRNMDLFLSSEVCVGSQHLQNYNFSLSMRQTSKCDLISGALMSLKQTLGPFRRGCSLHKVSMCWMVLDQSSRLAFSGIYPARTWWEKLAATPRPPSLPLPSAARLDSLRPSLPVKLYFAKMDAFSYIHGIRGSAVTSKPV